MLLDDGMLYGVEDETLSDLSGGAGGFEGLVGKSDDLSHIYFVDSEALTPPEEENANGEAAQTGKPNLYLWEEGAVRFIATLAPSDNKTGGDRLGTWHAAAGDRLAQATPDGRFLSFESRAPITGYDSTIAGAEGCLGAAKIGIPQCFEVFEYDAQEETLDLRLLPTQRRGADRPLQPGPDRRTKKHPSRSRATCPRRAKGASSSRARTRSASTTQTATSKTSMSGSRPGSATAPGRKAAWR